MSRISRSQRWALHGGWIGFVVFLVDVAMDPPGWSLRLFYRLAIGVGICSVIGGMLGKTRSLVPLGFLIGSVIGFATGATIGLDLSALFGLLTGGFLGALVGSIVDSIRRVPR